MARGSSELWRPLNERARATYTAIEHRIERPADEYLEFYALALKTQFDQRGPMYELIVEVLENRPDIKSSHLLTLVQRALQARTYKNPDFRDPTKGYVFPEEFLSEEAWHQLFERVLGDPDMHGAFLTDVLTRDPQSNLLERYINLKAVTVMLRKLGRLGATYTMIDAGCSLNGGSNLLASGLRFGLPGETDVGITTPEVYRRHRLGATALYYSRMLTSTYHRAANADEPTLEHALGIDKQHPKDAWNWAYANSFNPSEALNTERVAFFDSVVASHYPNVDFHRANFAELDLTAFAKQYPGQRDITNLSAMIYLSPPEEQEAILNTAKALSRIVVLSDFGEVPYHNRRRFVTLDDWNSRKLPWITAVWDTEEHNPKWQVIIMSTDGRVRKIVIGEGMIRGADGHIHSFWKPIQDFMT